MPAAVEEKPKDPQPGAGKDGGDGDGAEAAPRQVDPRCQWFEEFLSRALRVKSEKFKKMLLLPESWYG